MNLNTLSISEAQKGLAAKQFSSVELTKSCLQQVKEIDETIHAYLTVCEKEALQQAKNADEQRGAGSVLTGIPFSMKDVFLTQGIRTTAGSKILENYIPVYNATVYNKLQEQKAVLIGKTNCDAWGHGSSTENSDFGPTKNPWDITRVPGGSSGGSAASIASQTCLFSIAEDTGGSIRLPASYCNIVGLKVSYGSVSRYGSIAFASSLDTVGPMAKTVEDCALVFRAIAGKDRFDATSLATPNNKKQTEKQHFTLGIPKEFFAQGIDKEVHQALQEAIGLFKKQGIAIKPVELPSIPYAIAAYYLLAPAETSSNLGRYDGIRYGNDRSKFGDEAKRRIMIGTHALSAGYYDAFYKKGQQVRTMIKEEFEGVFKTVDALIAPVAPMPPFKLGEKTADPLAMYLVDAFTIPINLAGVPSLSLPAGFTKSGLPIGMQLIGQQQSEETLFTLGALYQKLTDWHTRKPQL